MSGSGGFYKYRCKYFYTYNCPNWVYANGHACPMCLAEGREAADTPAMAASSSSATANPWRQYQHHHHHPHQQTEICVPQASHGTLRYTVMEVIPTDEGSGRAYWILRQKVMEPPRTVMISSSMTTSDTPRPVMAPATGVSGMAGMAGMGVQVAY
ncbi:hypothetical protein MFIFM68171_03306 [Madurella fahalii]|uniref:Uncharacterized protein n=1 Tax=Madurella fahalii TaxID=1157608 RepID=A0ABQ0G5R2_9PEZI